MNVEGAHSTCFTSLILTLNVGIVELVCVAHGDHAGRGVEIDEVGRLGRGGQTYGRQNRPGTTPG
jgi:hypothetical protein